MESSHRFAVQADSGVDDEAAVEGSKDSPASAADVKRVRAEQPAEAESGATESVGAAREGSGSPAEGD